MPAPALALLDLSGGIEPALASVPPRPGVGQLLGPDGRNLVLGTTANLRRWAASHLGLGKPAPAGRRVAIERPRSPWATRESHTRYCTGSGRSKP